MEFISIMPTAYELVITGIAILICTITDIRNGTIFPLVCLALVIAAAFEPGKDYALSLISAGISFSILFIIARFGKGGDGDALLNGAVGFTLPLMYMLYVFLIASVAYALVLGFFILRTHNREMQLPYAPFILVGWIVTLILFLTGVFA